MFDSGRRTPPRASPASCACGLRGPWSLLEDPAVPVFIQVSREVGITALHDLTVVEDVDEIRDDVVQEALVMGHDEHSTGQAAPRVDFVRNDAQPAAVEAGCRFIEDATLRSEARHVARPGLSIL